MKSPEQSDRPRTPPIIRRATIGEINFYEIQESELEKLAEESSDSLLLNVALVLLPVGLSLLVVLVTTKIDSPKTFAALVALCFVSFVLGVVFLALGWRDRIRTRAQKSALVETIRRRLPPPVGTQETGP